MKNAIVAFLMSAVVATATGWIKDKLSFPMTAVDQVKALAADADASNLAMKALGGDVEKMASSGMQICAVENKANAESCVTKGVDFLKSIASKREEVAKAAAATQSAASGIKTTLDGVPFADSAKPLLEPVMKRLAGANESLTASTADLDFSMANLATRLSGMKASEGVHDSVTKEIDALKAGGLGKAFERVQMLADLAKKK